MIEVFLQILLVTAIAVAVKVVSVLSAKRGISPIIFVLPLGVVLGPTVFNIFGAPVIPGSGWLDDFRAESLMKILIELAFIQIAFAAGTTTDFGRLKKQIPAFGLIGSCAFLIPALISTLVLKIFGASWTLALAAASVVAVGSVALAPGAKRRNGEVETIARGVSLTTFILGAIFLIAAAGWRYEPTHGATMTLVGIVYFLLKAFLLIGSAFVVGRTFLRKIDGRREFSRTIQGMIGFVLLFAVFYGWAAWSVGPIAALPVAFVFGGLFARSKFEIREKTIASLSKPDSWLISLFYLAFGLSADFSELQAQIGVFGSLLAAAAVGKFSGAVLGAKITERTTGEGLKIAALTFPIGEAGLILAFFAMGRGILVPEVFVIVAAVITLTTFAHPFLPQFEQPRAKNQALLETPKTTKKQARQALLKKAVSS